MVRKRLLIVGAVILLALAATLIIVRCAGPESATSGEPRSYDMTSAWDNKDVGLPIGYHAESGTILMWERRNENDAMSPHRVAALEIGTGKRKWVNAPDGWDANVDYVRGNRLTAQAIVIQSNYNNSAPAVAALRLSDGKVLWKVNTPGRFARPTAVTANVVVVAWDNKTLRGLGAGDGAKLWEAQVASGCTTDEVRGDGDLFVAEVVCEKKRYLESFDPATGKSRWQRDMPIEGKVTHGNLSVRGGAAMLEGEESLFVVGRSGDIALRVESRYLGDVRFTSSSDVAVVAYRDEAGVDTLTAVGLGQAKVRWTKVLAIGSLSLVGNKLYSLAPLPEPLAPAGLYEIDMATGRMAVTPTHLLRTEYDSLVAIKDGIIASYYTARSTPTNTSHLEGHRLEPLSGPAGFAGGAPAGEWPDSCSLLQPAEVGESYAAQPQQATVVDTVRPASWCRFQPSSITSPVVTVGISWVGADTKQAVQVMARIRQQHEAILVPAMGDEAVQIEVFGSPKSRTDVYFRVGPRIGKVSIVGDSALALKLAKLAVTRLG
ncbi:MAG TPA: hypothetical protein DGG94_09070 [Micromonosporaceae bacterium]|nr:hypothetical protein [Micromonosporaceae bacterium]HCU49936.1 hypothetical protein [Micromonosporaceae bacterium]